MSTIEKGTAPIEAVERFAGMTPGEFETEVEKSLSVVQEITAKVSELVESSHLTPLQGLGIIGCATSQVYATWAFHGQPTLVDALAIVRGSGGFGSGSGSNN